MYALAQHTTHTRSGICARLDMTVKNKLAHDLLNSVWALKQWRRIAPVYGPPASTNKAGACRDPQLAGFIYHSLCVKEAIQLPRNNRRLLTRRTRPGVV